jgi:hypothetical protein
MWAALCQRADCSRPLLVVKVLACIAQAWASHMHVAQPSGSTSLPAGVPQGPALTTGLPSPPPVTHPTLVTITSAAPTSTTGQDAFKVPDPLPAPEVNATSDGLHHLAEAAGAAGSLTSVSAAGDDMGVRGDGLQLEPVGADDVLKVLDGGMEEPESHPILGEPWGCLVLLAGFPVQRDRRTHTCWPLCAVQRRHCCRCCCSQ